jgi:hypothetical protein
VCVCACEYGYGPPTPSGLPFSLVDKSTRPPCLVVALRTTLCANCWCHLSRRPLHIHVAVLMLLVHALLLLTSLCCCCCCCCWFALYCCSRGCVVVVVVDSHCVVAHVAVLRRHALTALGQKLDKKTAAAFVKAADRQGEGYINYRRLASLLTSDHAS